MGHYNAAGANAVINVNDLLTAQSIAGQTDDHMPAPSAAAAAYTYTQGLGTQKPNAITQEAFYINERLARPIYQDESSMCACSAS